MKSKINIILLGDSGTGKTSIVKRIINADEDLIHTHSTLGLECVQCKYADKLGNKFCINLWDTAGSERFGALTQSFYK